MLKKAMDPRIIEQNVLKLRVLSLLKILLIPLIAALVILSLEALSKLILYIIRKNKEKKKEEIRNKLNK